MLECKGRGCQRGMEYDGTERGEQLANILAKTLS